MDIQRVGGVAATVIEKSPGSDVDSSANPSVAAVVEEAA